MNPGEASLIKALTSQNDVQSAIIVFEKKKLAAYKLRHSHDIVIAMLIGLGIGIALGWLA